MSVQAPFIGKILSPRVVMRAVKTFDRATTVIVVSSWTGALFIMLFALYTLTLSVKAERDVAEAAAQEPLLPKIVSRPPDQKEMDPLVDRLKKRFPELTFVLSQDKTLTISANTGDKFRSWLTVLSYIDTISPGLRWYIKDFCVGGSCSSTSPMQAVLRAEKISFSRPSKP